jgi:hypothetical protein
MDPTKKQHRKLKRWATRTTPKTGVNLFVPCCFFFWALPVLWLTASDSPFEFSSFYSYTKVLNLIVAPTGTSSEECVFMKNNGQWSYEICTDSNTFWCQKDFNIPGRPLKYILNFFSICDNNLQFILPTVI